MAEERKVAAVEVADTEGKASISEKLRAAEGNISRAADEAKARKSEQAKTQRKTESEAKARLEEEERVRLERERAARLVAEQKMAAFEYAENYRKKLMRDKKKTESAAKQKAREEKAAAEAEEKRVREAEIAAMLEKERREARERGNRASALLNRVSKLAVVDGEGNLHVVDKKEPEAAPAKAAPAPAPEKIERVEYAPAVYSAADEKIDGRIYISDDLTGGEDESAVASVVTEEDGRLILNITDERDDRMVVEVFDGDEAAMARDYERFVKYQAAAAEAYNKEMKRMAEAYEAFLNLANPKAEAEEPVAEPVAEETVAEEPVAETVAEPQAEAEPAPAKPEPEIVEAPIPAPIVVAAVEKTPDEEPVAEPVAEAEPVVEEAVAEEPVVAPVAEAEAAIEETAPVAEEKAEEPVAEPEKKEKKKKEKPEKAKKIKEVKEPEDEEPSVEAAAVVAVDEGIVAELRAIAEKVDGIKSLKRYLAKVNKAEKRINREVLRLNKKLETPDVNEAPATVVEKLVLLSDLLEIKSDALAAATRIVAKKFAKRLKAELTALIDEYNRTASSYAAMTGEQLTRVSGFLPKYIAEGTGVAVIPKLTYSEKYVEVNEEDKAANASYVFVFPNINDIAEGGTLTATPDVKTTDGEGENSLAKRIIITSPYTNEELLDTASVYNARELKRAVAKVKKAYKKLDREVALIEKKRQAAVEECDERESLKMMVEEITVRRQKVEITATLLGYSRDVRVKKLTAAVKADMIEAMAEYNKSIDRYNNVTGESLTRAAAYMADEILEGKPAPRLAKLAYYRELVETVGDSVKVIGRKDKKKALPTTSCTFIFGTTPIVTAGPVGAPAAPAMPALQAQIVPPTSPDAQPAVVLSPAPAPAPQAAPAPAPAPVVIPAVVDEPTPIISISDITAPAPKEEPAPKAEPEVVVAEPTVDEFDEGELAAMDQREYKKLVARNEKKISAYQKKLEAHDKAKNRSAGPDRAALVIDCIEDLRCIIGVRCEVLELCVHVNDTKATNLNRASLLSDISRYNEYVSEYNLNARELIPTASTEMVDLILAGKPYKKLPKVVRNAKKTTAKVAPVDNSLAEYVRANTAEIAAKHDEYKKLTKKVKRAKGDGQKASLLVQCINIRVANVNKLVEQLDRCATAKHTKFRKSTVKALNAEIKAYNSVAEEYTKLSGRVVVLADPKLPRTVINGKPYAKLLAVSDAGIAAGRLQDNTATGGRSFADSMRITEVRTETEAKCEEQKKKAIASITDELDFFVDKLYSKRKALSFNFTGVKASARRKIARITSKMAALERRAKKAVKFEALDNARYYEAVLTDVSSLTLKRESDRNELREIQHRIAELLNQRDAKNVDLINHYSGTDKDVLKEQKRAHREVRFKAERKTFNSLRKIDKSLKKRYDNGEIDAYKPDRIHTAMHDMIEAKGEIAVCSARLKEARKTKLTKHQREMVKKERRGWQKKYDEAHKRLKNNLKTNVLSHMVPIGILLLVLLAGVIALVVAWPTISAWLASMGIGI